MAETAPVTFDTTELLKASRSLRISDEELKEVLRMAMDDTAMWANKEAAKDLGQALKVPYPAMRKRLKAKKSKGGGEARVWFGLNSVDLKYLKPKQTGTGVTTTAKSVSGAFIVPKLNSHVFKRTGEKRVMKRGLYRGKVREVIDKQGLDVNAQAMVILDGIINPKVAAHFMDRLFFYLDRMSGSASGSASQIYNRT